MFNSLLNLEGVTILTKDQQKIISGGYVGTCAYQHPNGFVVIDASKEEAISGSETSDGHWCCDSCCGASWTQGYGC